LKWINFLLLAVFLALMLYAAAGLPGRADATAPFNRDLSPAGTPNAASYYIHNSYKDARTPNMVTVVLVDYRGYDTLGEVAVIFTAGLICYLILSRPRKNHETG